MDKKKRKPGPTAQRAAMEDAVTLREQGRGDILSDVLGSYTGTAESGEIPEQDGGRSVTRIQALPFARQCFVFPSVRILIERHERSVSLAARQRGANPLAFSVVSSI